MPWSGRTRSPVVPSSASPTSTCGRWPWGRRAQSSSALSSFSPRPPSSRSCAMGSPAAARRREFLHRVRARGCADGHPITASRTSPHELGNSAAASRFCEMRTTTPPDANGDSACWLRAHPRERAHAAPLDRAAARFLQARPAPWSSCGALAHPRVSSPSRRGLLSYVGPHCTAGEREIGGESPRSSVMGRVRRSSQPRLERADCLRRPSDHLQVTVGALHDEPWTAFVPRPGVHAVWSS